MKGVFVGYSDQSKDYGIYILGFRHIEIRRNVTFGEHVDFSKFRKEYADKYNEEEQEAPKIAEVSRPPVRDVEEESIP